MGEIGCNGAGDLNALVLDFAVSSMEGGCCTGTLAARLVILNLVEIEYSLRCDVRRPLIATFFSATAIFIIGLLTKRVFRSYKLWEHELF